MIFIKTRTETKKKIYNDDNNNSVGKNYNYIQLKTIKKLGKLLHARQRSRRPGARWPMAGNGPSSPTALGKAGTEGFPRDAGENHCAHPVAVTLLINIKMPTRTQAEALQVGVRVQPRAVTAGAPPDTAHSQTGSVCTVHSPSLTGKVQGKQHRNLCSHDLRGER